MSYSLYTSTILSFIATTSLAQTQTATITGTIQDNKKQPIGYADIRLFNSIDSSLLGGAMTNEKGEFEIDAIQAEAYMIIEFIGYNSLNIPININKNKISLGNIILQEEKNVLNEVVVTREKTALELKLDKRVYNVDADLNNQGTNASEMLENIPSVTVDAEGNVSLRGNENVRILIDGKYSGFASSGEALKNLQSDQIEKVEIVTNASSRYDAQGDAGIINIILKKNANKGWNGSINARAGYNPDAGLGIQMNHKKDKLNINFGYNTNYHDHPGTSNTYQRVTNDVSDFAYRQEYVQNRKKFRQDGNLGMDYDFNDRNKISASVNFRTGNGNNNIDRQYDNLDVSDLIISRDNRIEDNKEKELLLEGNITYNHKLKNEGTWNTAVKWFNDKDDETSDFTDHNSVTDITKIEKSSAKVLEKYWLAQSDLVLPIGKDAKLETGFRSQFKSLNNQFGYSQLNSGVWESPARFNDEFDYNEDVHALYVMGSNTYNNLSMQAGLRAENTQVSTLQYSNNESIKKNYTDYFPSAAISYKLKESNTLQFSYSKRVQRPGQWDLMPFRKFGDNREMRIGNPDINPVYTHVLELGYMKYFTTGSILASVYYKGTTDKIERMAEIGPDNIIYRKPLNLTDVDAIGLELNGSYSPIKWLRFTTGFNFFKENVTGEYLNQDIGYENFSWTNRTTINLTLPKQYRVQIASNYEGARKNAQGRTKGTYYMDLGASKDILNNRATIGLNVRDVFNSRIWRNTTDANGIYAYSEFQWRPRSIRLTFSYRFNQAKKENERIIQSDMDMEG